MSTVSIIILLLLGACLGYEVPAIAERIAQFKYRKKNLALKKDPRFTALSLKIGICALNGAVFALSGLLAESLLTAILTSILFTLAQLITIIDIRIRIIPNELLLVLIVTGTVFQATQFSLLAVITSLLCMVAMIILFTAVAGFVGMDKVGAGDVKLAGAMGIALGYPNTLTAVIIMSAVFLIFSLGGILLHRLTLKSMLPFAPFMMTGMVFTLVFMVYR